MQNDLKNIGTTRYDVAIQWIAMFGEKVRDKNEFELRENQLIILTAESFGKNPLTVARDVITYINERIKTKTSC